jgi:molecular chaperone DnaJ
MSKKDPYEVLGVGRNATAEEIKKAYRKQAIKHHPDKNPGDHQAEDKFKEAAGAYEILSDPEKKAKFDRFGHNAPGGFGGGGFHGGGMNMDDIFSQFGDIFGGGGAVSGFGQRGARWWPHRERQQPARAPEAEFGRDRTRCRQEDKGDQARPWQRQRIWHL